MGRSVATLLYVYSTAIGDGCGMGSEWIRNGYEKDTKLDVGWLVEIRVRAQLLRVFS